jgi:hypothetical protein
MLPKGLLVLVCIAWLASCDALSTVGADQECPEELAGTPECSEWVQEQVRAEHEFNEF